jgi:hypothetical protein
MLHKFEIISCAFILCLFGLTLMTVSPVFAGNDQTNYDRCANIKSQRQDIFKYKRQMVCYKKLSIGSFSAKNTNEESDETEVYSHCEGLAYAKAKMLQVDGSGGEGSKAVAVAYRRLCEKATFRSKPYEGSQGWNDSLGFN